MPRLAPVLVLLLLSAAVSSAAPRTRASKGQTSSASRAIVLLPDLPPEQVPPREQVRRVYAGVFLSDVSGFDLKEGRFKADLEAWVKWQGAEEPPAITFLNGEIDSREEVMREADGDWRSVRWRIQGTFRGTFPLHAFPFDSQVLRVQLSLPAASGELIPDLASSGMSSHFSITGWLYEPYFSAQVAPRVLATDLGSVIGEGIPMPVSSLEFAVELHRPFFAYLLKFILPLAVILLMGVLSFLLPVDRIDVRASITVTALLSVVAFHFSQSSTLPDVSYLVVADKIFLSAYGIVFVLLLMTVVNFNLGDRWPRTVRWADRAMFVGMPLFAVLAVASFISGGTRVEETRPPELTANSSPAPSPGEDELRIGVSSLSALNTGGVLSLLYRGLYVLDDRGERRPHLVERLPSMTNSDVRFLPDGGMTVQWTLKPALRWSDGAPLTADDLVYSLELVTSPARRAIRKLDERTIVVEYSDRRPQALTDFTVYPRVIAEPLSADGGIAAVTARVRTEPLPGDGPYRLVSFDPKEGALLERNPYFAGQPPRLKHLRFVITGGGKGGDAYKAGKVDWLGNLGVDSMAQISRLPDTVATVELGDSLLFLQPDLTVAPLDDPRVRRALVRAIDRSRIGKLMYGERMRLASSFRPPEADDFAEGLPLTPHDPKGARALLAAAGMKTPVVLPLFFVESPAGSSYDRLVKFLIEDFAAVGIQLTLRPTSSKNLLESFLAGRHGGLLIYSRRDSEAPARFFNLPYDPQRLRFDTQTPRPHFGPELVSAYERFGTTLFVERKHVLSRRLQQDWAENLPLLPIAFSVAQSAHIAKLKGYSMGRAESAFWNVETWFLDSNPEPPRVAGDDAP